MTNQNYDVAVIGGGPGGYVAAIRAAQLGLKTICIEKRKTLGGTCLNVGCIPSKAMLETSHKFHDAAHNFEKLGIKISKPQIDVKKLLDDKNNIISGLTKGIAMLFKKNKVEHLNAYGKLIDKNTIDAEGKKITAKNTLLWFENYG